MLEPKVSSPSNERAQQVPQVLVGQCGLDGEEAACVRAQSKIGQDSERLLHAERREESWISGVKHCDSKKEIEDLEPSLEMDEYFTCRICNADQSSSEESLPARECRKCGIEHLEKNMFQKITGWLCYSCANEYEQALMKVTA